MGLLTEAAHLARSCPTLNSQSNMFSVHIEKRTSPLSGISLEDCRDLGKQTEKVLKATPKVLGDIRIMLSRYSFYPARRVHMKRT